MLYERSFCKLVVPCLIRYQYKNAPCVRQEVLRRAHIHRLDDVNVAALLRASAGNLRSDSCFHKCLPQKLIAHTQHPRSVFDGLKVPINTARALVTSTPKLFNATHKLGAHVCCRGIRAQLLLHNFCPREQPAHTDPTFCHWKLLPPVTL
eukprot:1146135-Pelagomonas_calceolata.AAC.12